MSVRSNGSGDQLTTAATLALGANMFCFAGWVKLISDRNQNCDLFGSATATLDPLSYMIMATDADGTGALAFNNDDGQITGTPTQMTVGTWYWIVMGRDATSGNWTLRVFDDSTSSTPLGTLSEATAAVYDSDNDFIIGTMFTGEWPDAEFENVKAHLGVYWTNAQARTESQNYDIQTAGGTKWGSWRLKSTAGSVDGLNDNTGNGRNLTNTGFVDGASTPSQLSTSTTPTDSDTSSAAEGTVPMIAISVAEF